MMATTARERRAEQVAPLFAYLRERGTSQRWLARRLGITPERTIYAIADGRVYAPAGFLEEAETVLQVKPGTFGGRRQRKSA